MGDKFSFSYLASQVRANEFVLPLTEFKEIRKEWKQRKKDEDNQRKAEEDRARAANGGSEPSSAGGDPNAPQGPNYPSGGRPQLPPLGYAPASGGVPQQYPSGVDQMYQQVQQGNGQGYAGYPHSPYGQAGSIYDKS